MTTKKLTKLLALYLPYILIGLVATNFGEAWRLAESTELGERIMSMMGTFSLAFSNPLPSFHPLDLFIGFSCGAGLRLAVYLRSKNAKRYRHGMEYGSARWGNAKDIEPFQALKAKGITQSMSRKATCLDNTVAENFFGLLKTELFYLEKFQKAIVEYIDYYNNRRIKLKLNGLIPVQYRIQAVQVT